MAFLRKSLSCLGRVNRVLKAPSYFMLNTPQTSSLHTMKSSPGGLQGSMIPALVQKCQSINYEPLLFVSKTVNTPQIMPALPRGKNAILDLPALPMISNLEMPTTKAHLNNDHIMPEKVKMEDPHSLVRIEKHARKHRKFRGMINIRKQKMKNHQRRKFYKKNRIIYARIRQARRAVKAKNLQLQLLARLNEGRNFNPQQYAFDLLSAAYEKVELPPKHRRKEPWEF